MPENKFQKTLQIIRNTENRKSLLFLGLFSIIGLLIRFILINKSIDISGDLLLYADWGERFWEAGPRSFYFLDDWYYAPPNYPPTISLLYGLSYWLYEYKFVLAQSHNLIKIPPAFFIEYFYDYGYYLLLKLPGILADLGLSALIYWVIFEITKDKKKALVGFIFYLINPISIFLSSVWGQSDSLVTLLGYLSFIFLYRNKHHISLPLFATSLYIKPNLLIFIPLYVYLLFIKRDSKKHILSGLFLSAMILFASTYAFSNDIFGFSWWLIGEKIISTANVAHKASVSAFNVYSIFFKLDAVSDSINIIGIPLYLWGYLSFSAMYLWIMWFVRKRKVNLLMIFFALYAIGFSSFLLLPNMLERYFFSALPALVIVMLTNKKLFYWGIILNLLLFLNVLWSFYRRSGSIIDNWFTANSFLPIRIMSVGIIFSFVKILKVVKKTAK